MLTIMNRMKGRLMSFQLGIKNPLGFRLEAWHLILWEKNLSIFCLCSEILWKKLYISKVSVLISFPIACIKYLNTPSQRFHGELTWQNNAYLGHGIIPAVQERKNLSSKYEPKSHLSGAPRLTQKWVLLILSASLNIIKLITKIKCSLFRVHMGSKGLLCLFIVLLKKSEQHEKHLNLGLKRHI